MAPTRSTPFPPPDHGGAHGFVRRSLAVAALVTASLAATAVAASAAATVEVTPPPIQKALPTKATPVRVSVKNVTKRRLTGLTVSVRAVKGVRVTVVGARKGKTVRPLRALGAGKATRVTVRLQRLAGGPKKGTLTVRVLRKKRTIGTGRLRFGAAAKPTGPKAPPTNPNTLAGRYFWGSQYTLNGIVQKTLYFANDGLVYTSDMEGAWAVCPAADEKCRPYQYTAQGNQLQVDGKPGELSGRTLKYDGQTYFEFAAPPAGSRWDAYVTYANSSGICPLYCSYFTEKLRFLPDGTFARDAVASGSGPVVDWAAVPPQNRGTYEVRADRTIRLAFADGKERIETIAFYVADDGQLKPAGEGMILDGDGYFDIDKDG